MATFMMLDGNAVMLEGAKNKVALTLKKDGKDGALIEMKNINEAPTMADLFELLRVIFPDAAANKIKIFPCLVKDQPIPNPHLIVRILP
jgi:hypothetical protein